MEKLAEADLLRDEFVSKLNAEYDLKNLSIREMKWLRDHYDSAHDLKHIRREA